jgi:[ribosomal protein S5]-alanine N-acetyltransferase
LITGPASIGDNFRQGEHVIETRNLQLIPCEPLHMATILRDKKGLELLLGVSAPDSWPVFPEAMPYVYERLSSDPSSVGWWTYLFVHSGDRVLVGEGGFKGKPGESNVVEIGYAIVPEYRQRGLATEAARGLARWAFSHPNVTAVEAETLPDGHGSIRVLEKLGTRLVGATDEVLSWRLDRQDFREEGGTR